MKIASSITDSIIKHIVMRQEYETSDESTDAVMKIIEWLISYYSK